MMKMLLRPAGERDLPAIRKILYPWIEDNPEVLHYLDRLFAGQSKDEVRCRAIEIDGTLRCVSLWVRDDEDTARLLALGIGNQACELGADRGLLREEVLDWADMGLSKVTTQLPVSLSSSLIDCLRSCGFITEGVVSGLGKDAQPRARLCKHFLYRTMPHGQVMDFLREFFVAMGYEVRQEEEGFLYRVRTELRRPFIFSTWHRITRNGPDIIVHPPARVLEWHELETLFYPLRILAPHEKPLLLPIDRKMASRILELPAPPKDPHQNSLFSTNGYLADKTVHVHRLTYSYPAGLKRIRRGLPLVFYVNGLGAVGAARVEEWYLDEPRNLYNELDEMSFFDPEDVKEQAAGLGPTAGKVLVIRFRWYKPLKRVVAFEEIRGMDDHFNPQRARTVSAKLFESILAAGNVLD
jgi:hypothetical protein